jgi:hypothetical protein
MRPAWNGHLARKARTQRPWIAPSFGYRATTTTAPTLSILLAASSRVRRVGQAGPVGGQGRRAEVPYELIQRRIWIALESERPMCHGVDLGIGPRILRKRVRQVQAGGRCS